ncbi:hypothetical protein [Catellatospora vulcania]|uniref:hypothetical protein n=1 Tax=Catellatospora vulcania TaxID=1460450 RepID=UPI0012D39910|nr:hypothetical protein [Catellatospora vulcania]
MIDVKEALRVRAAHVAELGWRNVLGALWVGFVVLCASFPLRSGIDAMRASVSGVDGTLLVTSCERHDGRKGGDWICAGRFRSADGTLVIDKVELVPAFEQDQTAAAPADREFPSQVTGPDAAYAYPIDSDWPLSLAAGLFMLGLACWAFWQWVTPPPDPPATTAKQRRLRHRAASRRRREAQARASGAPPA